MKNVDIDTDFIQLNQNAVARQAAILRSDIEARIGQIGLGGGSSSTGGATGGGGSAFSGGGAIDTGGIYYGGGGDGTRFCIAPEMLVLTRDGIKRTDELSTDDFLIDDFGRPQRVGAVNRYKDVERFLIKIGDYELICSTHHPLKTTYEDSANRKTIETCRVVKDIQPSDGILTMYDDVKVMRGILSREEIGKGDVILITTERLSSHIYLAGKNPFRWFVQHNVKPDEGLMF